MPNFSAESLNRLIAQTIQKSAQPILWASMTGKIVYANQAVSDFLGYSLEELDHLSLFDMDLEWDQTLWEKEFQKGAEMQGPYLHKTKARKKDGTICPVEIHAQWILFEGQNYVFSTLEDITAREEMEQSLRDSEEKYFRVFQHNPIAIVLSRFDTGKIVDVNEAFQEVFNYPRQEVLGLSAQDLGMWRYLEDRAEYYRQLKQYRKTTLTVPFLTPKGQVRYGRVQGEIIQLKSQEYVVTTVKDLTDQYEVEKALRQSEARFRTLIEKMHLGIVIHRSGVADYANLAAHRLFGYDPGDLAGIPMVKLFSPASFQRLKQQYQHNTTTGGAPAYYELTGVRKDGTEFLVSIDMLYLDMPEGPAMIGLMTDITESKTLERRFKLSQASITNNRTPIFWLDTKGRVIFANEAACKHLGYSMDEMLQLSVPDFDARWTKEKWTEEGWESFKKVGSTTFESVHQRKDGMLVPIEVQTQFFCFEGVEYLFAFVSDITERKKASMAMEQHLRQIEGMSRIQQRILSAQSPERIAEIALEQMQELLPFYAGRVLLYDAKARRAVTLASRTISGSAYQEREKEKPSGELTPGGLAFDEIESQMKQLQSGRSIYVMDVSNPQNVYRKFLLFDSGIASGILVPMVAESGLIGVLIIAADYINAYDVTSIEVTRQLADSLALAIEQTRLLKAEQHRRIELEMVEAISTSLRRAEKKEQLYNIFFREMMSLFKAEAGAVFLAQGDEMICHLCRGSFWQLNERLEKNWMGGVLRGGAGSCKPVFYDCKMSDYKRPMAMMPIQSEDWLFGWLILVWPVEQELGQDQQTLLLTIAEMAGISLSRIHALENLESKVIERTRELRALYEIVRIYVSEEDISSIASYSIRIIIDTLGALAGLIHLVPPGANSLQLMAHRGIDEKFLLEIDNYFHNSDIVSQILQNDRPLIILNLSAYTGVPESLRQYGGMRFIGIPIRASDASLGTISLVYPSDANLSLDDMSLLNLVADQLGLVIERAILRQQARYAVVMEERQRLARELHDSVTQSLYSLTFLADGLRTFAEREQWERVRRQLTVIQETSQQSLKEMRLLVYELVPASVEQQGLEAVLTQRLNYVERRAGIDADLKIEGELDLPLNLQLGVYWIAQEALNNSIKHASASKVRIYLKQEQQSLYLKIEDNGKGFSLPDVAAGMGLKSMRERAEHLGGSLQIITQPGSGTRVIFEIEEIIE